jgi:anti-sigma regulatory factor (Ser/Thr protein kinase)
MENVIAAATPAIGTSILLTIDEQSQIGAARRSAAMLGHANGLGSDALGRLAIVVTEAAANIVRHAHGGSIVLRALSDGTSGTIEMLALDKGRGIPDVNRALRDGFSTLGTAGEGLGAIHRMADVFAVYSQPGLGTALLARVEGGPRRPDMSRRAEAIDDRIGVVCVPMRGEVECGDAWRVVINRHGVSILVVDGLGHGAKAAEAAAVATARFASATGSDPHVAVSALDVVLRGSRGAALSIAVIDDVAREVRFTGVGNVDGRVLSAEATGHLVPQNGIVGHTMPTLRVAAVAWPVGSQLIMHSDGISSRWRLEAYPGLADAHPALIAGVIFRDFSRVRDDATVIVVRDSRARTDAE